VRFELVFSKNTPPDGCEKFFNSSLLSQRSIRNDNSAKQTSVEELLQAVGDAKDALLIVSDAESTVA
jgi:hypothetical protein